MSSFIALTMSGVFMLLLTNASNAQPTFLENIGHFVDRNKHKRHAGMGGVFQRIISTNFYPNIISFNGRFVASSNRKNTEKFFSIPFISNPFNIAFRFHERDLHRKGFPGKYTFFTNKITSFETIENSVRLIFPTIWIDYNFCDYIYKSRFRSTQIGKSNFCIDKNNFILKAAFLGMHIDRNERLQLGLGYSLREQQGAVGSVGGPFCFVSSTLSENRGSGSGSQRQYSHEKSGYPQIEGFLSPKGRVCRSISSLPLGAKIGITIIFAGLAWLIGVIGIVRAIDGRSNFYQCIGYFALFGLLFALAFLPAW